MTSKSFAAVVLGVLLAVSAQAQRFSSPAEAPRTIEFTTDEGTWISLDVPPDGRTIAFELLGDIYTLPIAGGQARPILNGPAFQSQPRFSPDGASLAFISDANGSDNVWIAGARIRFLAAGPRTSTPLDIVESFSPIWS